MYSFFPSRCIMPRLGRAAVLCFWLALTGNEAKSQSVSEIITDYNGYWKTGQSAISSIKPDNHHNLLSFSYNGTRYSTGVNDPILTDNGQTFTPGVFRALPMQNYNGTVGGNTKIGLGAAADGVINGAGPAPSRNLGPYLNDGTNGLDMGTCVANMPSGTLFLSVSNLQAANIGDGVPDILVTQVADPSSNFDAYEFTDIDGVRIGNSLNVVLNNIAPIGTWVADFYEATGSAVLTTGFTQTERAIRLWAADFSSFGINASNIGNISYFKINLSGTSDLAFVAYNTTTISVDQMLSLPTNLQRQTRNTDRSDISDLTIFPNPATASVNISHPKAGGTEKVVVYNMNGLPVLQTAVAKNAINTRVNISALLTGSYQVTFVSDTKTYCKKLVVAR